MTKNRNSITEYARLALALAIIALAFAARGATTNVTLAWNANVETNLIGYRVFYGTTSGTYSGSKLVAANVTSTTVSNLTAGQTYYFAAKATNAAGLESAYSTQVVYATPSVPNTAPVAIAQTVTTAEDSAKAITLTGTDVDGNSLTFSIVSSTISGLLSGTLPNITYTPAVNFNGTDSFVFKANDGIVDSTPVTVTINVSPVNDAPVAFAQSVSTTEDTAKAITLTGSDVDGNSLAYTVVATPAHGALNGTAPNITYTPAANYSGADSFTFKVNDGTVDSSAVTVSITVVAANDAPVAVAQSVTTPEDVAKVITLSATDADANALTYAIITSPAHGALTGTPPNMTYRPATNYNGSDSFTFRANDGSSNSAPATVAITITPVNDIPLANAQTVTTDKNVPKALTLTGSDVDENTLTFVVVTQPTKGTLSGTMPNLTYTPNNNVTGSDSFTFKANDGTADSAVATVAITIAPGANSAPVAIAQDVTTSEDVAKAITLSATDVDGGTPTCVIVTWPAHGTLTGTVPNMTYRPATNYNGSDSFTFRASDGSSNSAPATVAITITPVNDAPLATTQSVATEKNVAKSITLGGSDVDGDTLTFTVATQPTKGTLSGTSPNLTYTPNNNVTGADVFTFTANDNTAASAAVPVYINITAGANAMPVANAQNVTTAEDTAKAITLSASDADGNALTYTIVTPPAHGTLSGTAPALTYTPTADYSGSDNFWFQASDGSTSSVPAVISITITPVNDLPTLNAIANLTLGSAAGSQTVALSGISAGSNESQPLSVTVGSSNPGLIPTPTVTYVSPGTTGSLQFTPATGVSGTSIVSVTVDDGQGQNNSATRSFTVTVNASNTTPTIALTAPTGGTSYSAPASIHLVASASATGHTINKVQFFGGTNLVGEDTSAPYEFDWNVADAGSYDVVARLVYDGSSMVDSKSVTVEVADLPGPWEAGKIGVLGNAGPVGETGEVTVSGNDYTVESVGILSGRADSCRYVYQSLNADGEIKIRLTSMDDMNKNSRAGVMIRESMIPGSKYAFVGISGDGYYRCQSRASTSATTKLTTIRGASPGAWLRLVRSGKTVTSYRSLDGHNWARLTSASVPMATNIYVGIVVASGDLKTLASSTFSSPTVVP